MVTVVVAAAVVVVAVLVAAGTMAVARKADQRRRPGPPAYPARSPRPPLPAAPPSTSSPRPAPPGPVAVAEDFTGMVLGAAGTCAELATAQVCAQLATSPGSPALHAQETVDGIRQRVQSVTAVVDDKTAASVGVSTAAVVRLDAGARWSSVTDYLDLLVVDTPAGWRVTEIDL